MARRHKKRAKKNAGKKVEKKPRLHSGNKKNKRKPQLDSGHTEAGKKPKPYSDRSQLKKNPTQESGKKSTKKTDRKTKTKGKEGKETNLGVLAVDTNESMSRRETNKLTREGESRMKELEQDGIIILVDQPNLEIGTSKKMRAKKEAENPGLGDDERWIVRYGRLKDVVARGRDGSENRKVLKTCIMTSKNSQRGARYQLSKRLQQKHNIEYLVSPNRNKLMKEKCVDAMVVRRMVEEYAALDIFRLQGRRVPKRTFCLLSADSDFVDVAKVTMERGFDVELWFFKGHTGFSVKNWERAKPKKCESGKCGKLEQVDLDPYKEKVGRWVNVKDDRDCSEITESSWRMQRR